MSCHYKEICPAYDERRKKCSSTSDCRDSYGNQNCIPLILEAYNKRKGTIYEVIRSYLRGDQNGR